MIRVSAAAAITALALVSSASANAPIRDHFQGDRYTSAHMSDDVLRGMRCPPPLQACGKKFQRKHRHTKYTRHYHRRAVVRAHKNPAAKLVGDAVTEIATPFGVTIKAVGVSLAGIVAPLAAKASAITRACPGAKVISAVRPGARVRGSGRPSLHASGKAVDISGNPRCVYAQLRGWPGGVSTDYGAVKHVHFSYAPHGREWGARFAHWGHSRRHRHYARHRRHHRYAAR
jgi:hypothetical protein